MCRLLLTLLGCCVLVLLPGCGGDDSASLNDLPGSNVDDGRDPGSDAGDVALDGVVTFDETIELGGGRSVTRVLVDGDWYLLDEAVPDDLGGNDPVLSATAHHDRVGPAGPHGFPVVGIPATVIAWTAGSTGSGGTGWSEAFFLAGDIVALETGSESGDVVGVVIDDGLRGRLRASSAGVMEALDMTDPTGLLGLDLVGEARLTSDVIAPGPYDNIDIIGLYRLDDG